MPDEEGNGKRAASPLAAVAAVLSAFFGVRRRADHEAVKLKPLHVIVTAVAAAAVFVVSLVLLVKFIVSRAG
jgi:hypothetical protein